MNYLIDGHNLISHIPGLDLSMPDDEERLIELLNSYGRDKRHRLEVYFDGAPAGQAGVRSFGRVRAHFVAQGSTADEAMRRRLIKLERSAAEWTVVSSDRAVQAAGREAHAHSMSAEEFAMLLQASIQAPAANEQASRDQPLSEAEVDEWLRIFKAGDKKK